MKIKKQPRFSHHINHHRPYASRKNRKRALGIKSVPDHAKATAIDLSMPDTNIFQALAAMLMNQQGGR